GGLNHARSHLPRNRSRAVRADGALRRRLRPHLKEATMFEAILGLVVAAGLAVYLVVTLLYPEKF
ncbi:K(+)-transporting ATPase subunit F, partial [Acinetobacter baumannii]